MRRKISLREHLLCKHAFLSPKALNRRLFTVQNPLLIGLLIGLQKIRKIHLKTQAARTLEWYPGRFHLLPVSPEAPKGNQRAGSARSELATLRLTAT